MMKHQTRLLAPSDLPSTLWSGQILRLAPILRGAYQRNLDARGLLELARTRSPSESPVGGLSLEATHDHFAKAFDGSAARAQLALMDPAHELDVVSDVLVTSCSGGNLVVLDLPCGAGAFSLSLLCSIAELRSSAVLPREPLDVIVIGGEISADARDLACAMFKECKPHLEAQAIHVEFKPIHWDVCDQASTTELNQRFVADADGKQRKLVAMANFNGFLVKEKKQKAARPQIDEIFRYASGGPWCTGVWLEPKMNAAKDQLLPWISGILQKLSAFFRQSQDEADQRTTSTEFEPPMQPGGRAQVRLAILRFDLSRRVP
jgi:hypothetical protein